MKQYTVFFVLALLLSECLEMKADIMRRISSQEGITNNSVLSLAQSPGGYIWFGTCDGLDLWTGDKIVNYPGQRQAEALSGNLIEEIIFTTDSLFWLRTNYGLDLFRDDVGVMESHRLFRGIYLAAARNSYETFVFAPGNRLYAYSPSSGSFHEIKWPGTFDFTDILEICLAERDIAWIFCTEGIYYAEIDFPEDGSSALMGQARPASGSKPLLAAFQKDKDVYIVDTDGLLSIFNTNNGQMNSITVLKDEIDRYGKISDIVGYGGGYMVSFLYNGVTHIVQDKDSGTYKLERLDIECGVFSLLKDRRQEIVWIGTDGQGVIMYAFNPNTFRSYSFDKLPFSLSKPVRALLVDSKGTLWVGTKGEGILVVPDFKNGERIRRGNSYLVTTRNSELADESVYAFEESRHDVIWIGTEGTGINYYSYSSGKIHTLKGRIPDNMQYIHGIHEDGDTLWIATVGCGVYRVGITKAPSGELYATDYELIDFGQELLNMDFFFSVYKDNDGSMLFGNRGGGLAIHNPVNKENKVLRFDEDLPIIANDVWTICRSRYGNLWLGTTYGLLEVSLEDMSFKESLVTKTVHGVLEDKYGNLWLSTNRGIIKYDPANERPVTYGYPYGVLTLEYSDGAYFIDTANQIMYFGGTNGFVTIDCQEDTLSAFNPPLFFSNVISSDSNAHIMSSSSENSKLIIPPNERIYVIEVDALDYIDGNNHRYSYFIKGNDHSWSETSKEIRFPDLSPGKYTLMVRYHNPVNGYTSPVSSMDITIRPPWYASVFAKILYVLTSIGILSLCSWFYIKRNRMKRYEQKEKLKIQHREEILDFTIKLFENIARELTMPLTMISGPCQQMLEYDKSDDYIKLHSTKILHQSDRLMNMVKMFYDFIESYDTDKVNVRMFSVSDMAEGIAGTFAKMADNLGISFSYSIVKDIVWSTLSKEVVKLLEILLTNAFVNVGKNGKVILKVWTEDNLLKIAVSNNGKKSNLIGMSEILDKFNYPLNGGTVSDSGISFKNEMWLAVCRNIVAKLEGMLDYDFNDEYLNFTVELPSLVTHESQDNMELYKDDNLLFDTAEAEGRLDYADVYKEQLLQFDVDKGKLMMYIIGKDTEIMNLIAELFSSQYNIKLFNDCTTAYETLCNNQPDIIICECLTAKDDVLKTIHKIKSGKITSDIPVILISGGQHSEEKIKGMESGADMQIGLPFDLKYLRASAEQLLNKLKSLKDHYQSHISAYQFTHGKILHKEDKEFIERMINIISENISDSSITTGFIAEKMNVSVRTLYNKLEGLINITPSNIIKEFRLMYVEKLLSTTKLTINEILDKAGYANRGTFFKNFSAKYGCTPQAYRNKLIREIEIKTS